MSQNSAPENSQPKLRQTLWNDIRRGDLHRTLRRDFRELTEFFLDDRQKERLETMGRFKRWFYILMWLLKTLFLKLTPLRRILLVIGVILLITSGDITFTGDNVHYQNDTSILGALIILFVLMLELKDKLLARNELAAGRAVQHALMPPERPAIPGWDVWLFTQPAREVGGDLVDFMQIDPGWFGISIGDVADKGLGAALFMSRLQATLRTLVPDLRALDELGAKINRIFHRDGLPNNFASLIYLEMCPDSGTVRLVNAGHIPPVLLKGGTIRELPKGAPALGLLPEATYEEQKVTLNSGDILFIYSDGVTDSRNEHGHFFGEQRVFDLLPSVHRLSARECGKLLLTEIKKFIGDAPVHDDLSMVILKKQ